MHLLFSSHLFLFRENYLFHSTAFVLEYRLLLLLYLSLIFLTTIFFKNIIFLKINKYVHFTMVICFLLRQILLNIFLCSVKNKFYNIKTYVIPTMPNINVFLQPPNFYCTHVDDKLNYLLHKIRIIFLLLYFNYCVQDRTSQKKYFLLNINRLVVNINIQVKRYIFEKKNVFEYLKIKIRWQTGE